MMKFLQSLADARPLLKRCLRLLLVLPEGACADLFFQVGELFLLCFYFKDNLEDAKASFSLHQTIESVPVPKDPPTS